jgi:hypothetical protein
MADDFAILFGDQRNYCITGVPQRRDEVGFRRLPKRCFDNPSNSRGIIGRIVTNSHVQFFHRLDAARPGVHRRVDVSTA